MEDDMIPEKMNKAINDQIAKELYSEYLYLAMATWFAEKNLDGFANWFYKQAVEEHNHAMKFMHFLIERGGSVKVPGIAEPKIEAVKYIDFFQKALEHEQYISKSINELMDTALEINDHASKSLLQGFVDEQVEEEANVNEILDTLRLINGQGNGIFMLDRELRQRVFVDPTATVA